MTVRSLPRPRRWRLLRQRPAIARAPSLAPAVPPVSGGLAGAALLALLLAAGPPAFGQTGQAREGTIASPRLGTLLEPPAGPEVAVEGPEDLSRALAAARPGTILRLAEGDYGKLTAVPAGVSLMADPAAPARFVQIDLLDVRDLRVRGIEVQGMFRIRGGQGIAITNGHFGMLNLRDIDRLFLAGNVAGPGHYGILLNSVRDFVLRDTLIRQAREDIMRITGDSYNGLVENNTFYDTLARRPIHPDLLQIFGANGDAPHDIVIRGNHFYDDPRTGDVRAQGIFIAKPTGTVGFRNFLIEDNLMAVPHPNTIYVSGGQENFVIRRNTLIAGAGDGGAIIRLAKGIYNFDNSGVEASGNVAKIILKETPMARTGDNFLYGRNADLVRLFSGPGARWQDFVPVTGSPIDFGSPYGAQARLKALLDQLKPGQD